MLDRFRLYITVFLPIPHSQLLPCRPVSLLLANCQLATRNLIIMQAQAQYRGTYPPTSQRSPHVTAVRRGPGDLFPNSQ